MESSYYKINMGNIGPIHKVLQALDLFEYILGAKVTEFGGKQQ